MTEHTINGICQSCKKEIHIPKPVGFSATCPYCLEYLHSCLHCRFYDHQKMICTAQVAERPKDPQSKNFCEEFQFQTPALNTKEPTASSQKEAKQKLENLFKNIAEDKEQKPKSIHDLFKD